MIRASVYLAAAFLTGVTVCALVPVTAPGVAPAAQAPARSRPVPAAKTPAKPAPLPLKFTRAPLGNVMRVFSARYGVPFTIEAKAKAPITGDFSRDDLASAVAAAAKQAGLYAIAIGKRPADGYRLSLHPPPPSPAAPKPKPPAAAPAAPALAAVPAVVAPPTTLSAAQKDRAALLRQRALLQAQAVNLGS